MVLIEKVLSKFQQIDEYLSILRKISNTPKELNGIKFDL